MAFSAGAASLEHIAQEAGDISGVAHADPQALLRSVQPLQERGTLVVLLEVSRRAIVQDQEPAASACGDLFHEAIFIKIFDAKHNKYLRVR